MYPTDLRERLAATLDPDPAPDLPPGTRFASVLLPLVASSRPSLIFTRRGEHLSRHAGEISFPGGLPHEEDANLEATALRETEEELGIPRSAVEVIGALAPVHTFVSGILIVPFVGVLADRPVLTPNEAEIAEVLEYTIEELAAAEGIVEFPRDGHVYRGFAYEMGSNTIWGATAKILHEMIERSGSAPYGPSDVELRSILGDARTIAVVGLSSRPERDSHDVAAYLQEHGYRIVPVNPNETEVLGETAYPSLLDVPQDIRIDVVDVFRRAADTPPIARDAVRVGAKVLWLQDGVVNDEARRIAEEAGLTVIMGGVHPADPPPVGRGRELIACRTGSTSSHRCSSTTRARSSTPSARTGGSSSPSFSS